MGSRAPGEASLPETPRSSRLDATDSASKAKVTPERVEYTTESEVEESEWEQTTHNLSASLLDLGGGGGKGEGGEGGDSDSSE